MKHQEITEQIIKAFYNVYNTLGYGFLEKVYETDKKGWHTTRITQI